MTTPDTTFLALRAQQQLEQVATNPLPPKWDGIPIHWHRDTPWTSTASIHICGRRKKPPESLPCPSCGRSRADELMLSGHLEDLHRRLTLFRCLGCGADQVLDWEGNVWDLGPEDYEDTGSAPTPTTLFDGELKCVRCGWAGIADSMQMEGAEVVCSDWEMCRWRSRHRDGHGPR